MWRATLCPPPVVNRQDMICPDPVCILIKAKRLPLILVHVPIFVHFQKCILTNGKCEWGGMVSYIVLSELFLAEIFAYLQSRKRKKKGC